MAEDKLLRRVSSNPNGRPRSLSDLFDPTAFEERLKLARARRAVALAQREANPAQSAARVPPARWAEPGPRFDPVRAPGFAVAPPATMRAETRPSATPPMPVSARPMAASATPGRWLRMQPVAVLRDRLARLPAGRARMAATCLLAAVGLGTVALFAPAGPPAVLHTKPAPAPQALPAQTGEPVPAVPAPAATQAAALERVEEPLQPAPAAPVTPAAPLAELTEAGPVLPALVPDAPPLSARLDGRPYPRPATLVAAAVPDPAPPGLDLTRVRVFLHFPASVGSEGRKAMVDELQAAGFASVEPIRAQASIDTTNVRYFHREDAAAAHLLASALGDGAVARDFTDISPPPRKGRLEVWVEGTAPASAAPPAAPEAILQILQNRSAQN